MTVMPYDANVREPHGEAHVLERVDHLAFLNSELSAHRARMRDIMNGGRPAIEALLGTNADLGEDLPAAHLMVSGMRKFAQRLRKAPDIKIDAPRNRDTETMRARADKRTRILHGYDRRSKLEMQMNQVGRWLPGYAVSAWVLKGKKDVSGHWFPHISLRDAHDILPGWFGPDQQPDEMGVRRIVPFENLRARYPKFAEAASNYQSKGGSIQHLSIVGRGRWESMQRDGVEVIEYYDLTGTYLAVPELGVVLDYIPNFLSRPHFVVAKRFAFDELRSHWYHSLGLMSHMAKLNVLALIGVEDSTFRETNVYGQMVSEEYERGRFAVNHFETGARIEKPGGDTAYQVFQQIDRLERQLRTTVGYPVTADGQSPMSFTTGQGLNTLNASSIDGEIAEYQDVIKNALEDLDSLRLEWDETYYPDVKRPITPGGKETYTPSRHIKGEYASRRVYGVMAGWDEPQKIVTALQLLQAGILDRQTVQENLDGFEEISKVNERITEGQVEDRLFDILSQRATEGDPAALMAMVEIRANPDKKGEVLAKYFQPEEEPQPSPQEQAMMAQQGLAGEFEGGAPPVTTILSRLQGNGAAEGGVQTVGRL